MILGAHETRPVREKEESLVLVLTAQVLGRTGLFQIKDRGTE
jgi:hypothetical protein